MEDNNFLIDSMQWSFSRLNSFYSNCKYEWYQHYIECAPSANGFFGEFGGFCHKCIEKYAKGELSIFDVAQYYEDHFFEEVPDDAPPNKYKDIKQDAFEKGLAYFENIDLPLDDYNVIGVEKEIHFVLEGYPFIGYIDLLLQDKNDGKYILMDHKSSSIKTLRSGEISKTDQEHFMEFKRQQYLYSKAVMEEFGDGCVKELRWNMFKDRKFIQIPFKQEEYDDAIKWAVDTIHAIEIEKDWLPGGTAFYCNFLCSMRNNACPYKVG